MNSAQSSEVAVVGTGLLERSETSHLPAAPPQLPDFLQRKELAKRFRTSRRFHPVLHKKVEPDTHSHIRTISWAVLRAWSLGLLPTPQSGSVTVEFLLVLLSEELSSSCLSFVSVLSVSSSCPCPGTLTCVSCQLCFLWRFTRDDIPVSHLILRERTVIIRCYQSRSTSETKMTTLRVVSAE